MPEKNMDSNNTFRFLIVDDSRAIQSIIRRCLNSCGYPSLDIRVESSGAAALATLEKFKPDLIITDWHMPGMSGLEFTQIVHQTYSKILIGFVTTETNKSKLDEARHNGAVFVLNKPFKDADFVTEILRALPIDRGSKQFQRGDTDFILSTERANKSLPEMNKGKQLSLIPSDPNTLEMFTDSNLIGLYGPDEKSKTVATIAILDMRAVALFWGVVTGASVDRVEEAIKNNDHSNELLTGARAFMAKIGKDIKLPESNGSVVLTRSSVVDRSFKRLSDILAKNSGRADFKLHLPGLQDGLITLIRVL